MVIILLGINAWTDLKEGCVYDLWSILLLMAAAVAAGFKANPYFIGSIAVLAALRMCDADEHWLGRGDYLILLSLSLYSGERYPLLLLCTSLTALVYLGIRKARRAPLVPFLFLGTLAAEIFR